MANGANMEQVGVRLPPPALRRVKELAEADASTPSQLIRKWVLERLERERP